MLIFFLVAFIFLLLNESRNCSIEIFGVKLNGDFNYLIEVLMRIVVGYGVRNNVIVISANIENTRCFIRTSYFNKSSWP